MFHFTYCLPPDPTEHSLDVQSSNAITVVLETVSARHGRRFQTCTTHGTGIVVQPLTAALSTFRGTAFDFHEEAAQRKKIRCTCIGSGEPPRLKVVSFISTTTLADILAQIRTANDTTDYDAVDIGPESLDFSTPLVSVIHLPVGASGALDITFSSGLPQSLTSSYSGSHPARWDVIAQQGAQDSSALSGRQHSTRTSVPSAAQSNRARQPPTPTLSSPPELARPPFYPGQSMSPSAQSPTSGQHSQASPAQTPADSAQSLGHAPPPSGSRCVLLTYAGRDELSDAFPPGLTGQEMALFFRTFAQQRHMVRDGGWAVFGSDGRFVPASERVPASEPPTVYVSQFLVQDSNLLRVVSDAGSSEFSNLPPMPFTNPDELEFLCYLAYLRRGGYKSQEVFNALVAFIAYPPFVLALARLVSRRRLTCIDFLVVRETLRAFMVFAFASTFKLDNVGKAIGFILSHWARLDISARVSIDIDAWKAPIETIVPNGADLRGRCGGPLDVVHEPLLRGRRTMSVVRVPGSDPVLALGRLPSGEHLVWDPRTLSVARHSFRALHSREALQQALRQDSDFVNQATVIVVDRSSSMGLIVPGPNRRALAMAIDFVDAFAAAVTAYSPSAIFGVTTRGDDIQWGVAIGQTDPGPAQQRSRFWVSLEVAEKAIVDLRLDGPKRILAITDGRDRFKGDFDKIAQTFRRDGVILDAFVLAAPKGPLLALCAATGGRAFQPATVDDGYRVLRREEFIDLSLRRVPKVPIRSLPLLLDVAQYNNPIPRADAAPVTFAASLGPPPPTFRDIRVAQELAECRSCGLAVFPAAAHVNGWRVLIEAPLFRGSSRRVFWILAVAFAKDYPYTCPTFRFLTVPAIANVSDTGRVFCTALRDYHPRVAIASLIFAIRELFDADDEGQLPLVQQEKPKWTSESEWLAVVDEWNDDNKCPYPSFESALPSLGDVPNELEVEPGPGRAPESWRIQYSQVSWRKIETRNEGSELLICSDENT